MAALLQRELPFAKTLLEGNREDQRRGRDRKRDRIGDQGRQMGRGLGDLRAGKEGDDGGGRGDGRVGRQALPPALALRDCQGDALGKARIRDISERRAQKCVEIAVVHDSASSMAFSFSRPRRTCDFTVPSGRCKISAASPWLWPSA